MPDFPFDLTVNTDKPVPTVKVGPDTAPPPPPPPLPTGTGVYQTSGRWLLDPRGAKVIGRGPEMPYWRASWLKTSFVDDVSRTGANQIRVLPYLTAATPTGDPKATVADVEDLIVRAVRGHMLCDLAIDGGQVADIWLRADVLALLKKYEPFLVLHALGESYAASNTAWRDQAIAVVKRLRAAGLRMPLTVMSRQGGRNLPCLLEQGAAVVAADPLHNVLLGWQAYWGDRNAYQTEYGMTLTEAMQRAAAAAFPIQVGLLYRSDPQPPDFSPQHVPYQELMRLAQELQLSTWWWDWRMGIDNMTKTGVGGPADWARADQGPGADGNPLGLNVSAEITRTSVRTAFQMEQTI